MTEATGIVGEFLSLKEETDADILTMQCGDFYEFFAEDAELVAEELDLKVSQKSSHGSSYPMAGVPVDDLTPYVSALVERGYRVAVADQHETADGHAREITRVVTPGTHLETGDAAAQYLAAVVRQSGRDGDSYGLAFADVTTGQFQVTQLDDADPGAVLTELYTFAPAEVLPGPDLRNDDDFLDALSERSDAAVSLHASESFAPGRARHRVREQFGAETLSSVGIADDDAAIAAAGAVLSYVEETGVGTLAAVTRLQAYGAREHVALDATTQRNLELTETMQGGKSGSLFDTVDHTTTAAGGRLLRRWLQRPRRDRGELHRRQSSVAALTREAMARETIRETLSDAYDLERLASRATSGSADARDLRAAQETLALLPQVADAVEQTERLAESPLADALSGADREAAADLAAELDAALVEDPPGTVTQGGLFRRGYDDSLDEIIDDHEGALEWLETLPQREKERTGITHLSVDRNKTDGYYIQVGKSETDSVPEAYEEIKTLKNSKRYTIPELDEKERAVLRLEERRHEMEYDLFEELRERVAERATLMQDVGRTLAEIDALASLAVHAVENDWTRPDVTDGEELSIEAGRHPVVEQTTEFVPNDLFLDRDRQFLVVTGPNMSGKSTYMRQAALITLLAQAGSFVPARDATVGLVDGIYTRVGALDELAQGRSTFMVEMQELSNILHSATEDSLVILDEVGRGTATFDGISIAWAATEYLHNEVRAKTLFATHYHELTTLADHLERVENVHVAVAGEPESAGEDGVTFLRTVRDGPTDRSYGIHVADMAGVPGPVVDRSQEVLDRLREEKAIEARGSGGGAGTKQAVFDLSSGTFGGAGGEPTSADGGAAETVDEDTLTDRFGEDAEDVLSALSGLDVNETPPVELMATVQQWQDELDEA
ncbi:DNA mismatch repair protein MutS [Haloarcula pellucida]|uniref:DNA mismatch repair protein MutS n=1 Tax=Haloarcula pellucida TaxID=1427151 RepID=A0A830GP74_9EURY|nr:DNA mismatch repair protein MutS [Halomicroarcula pellucida]MBX0350063.1 DNA mismatch repair protein MutS [Halomicroarcula pellucida]GGO00250.1 DNA mismatch repair protein MutS [Halomicroarcula pellucida]